MIAGRAGASPTQGTVSAGELVSEGLTDLRTDLPRQRNDGDRHASDAAADSHARGAGFAPLEAVRRPRARPQQQPRRSATTTTALARTAPAAPPHGVNGSRKRPAVGAGRLHPVGGSTEYELCAAPCARSVSGLRRGLQARVPDARAAAGPRRAVQRGVLRGACAARVQLECSRFGGRLSAWVRRAQRERCGGYATQSSPVPGAVSS